MKKVILSFVLILTVFTYKNVLAVEECSTSKMTRLKELANNVQFKSSYEIDEELDEEYKNVDLYYSMEVLNFNDDLRIEYKREYDDEYTSITSNEKKITGFLEGDKITFRIYSYTADLCTDEILKTTTVNLPYYNDYYYFNKDKCNGHDDFKYCKEFVSSSVPEFSEIDKEFNEYLNSNSILNVRNINNITWYIVIGIVLVFMIFGIIFTIKRKGKRKKEL